MRADQQARQAVLDALLGSSPLPGGVQPLVFPDVGDLSAAPSVVLVTEAGDPDLRLPERVHSSTARKVGPRLDGKDVPVLQFLRPEAFPDRVGVRLRVSRTDDSHRPIPLGEVVVTFTRASDGTLTVSEPTHVVAY